jgi:hypothetical protein
MRLAPARANARTYFGKLDIVADGETHPKGGSRRQRSRRPLRKNGFFAQKMDFSIRRSSLSSRINEYRPVEYFTGVAFWQSSDQRYAMGTGDLRHRQRRWAAGRFGDRSRSIAKIVAGQEELGKDDGHGVCDSLHREAWLRPGRLQPSTPQN